MSTDIVNHDAADALVLFGATGDLCHRKIFPSLYQLVRHGRLTVPVIGVAKAGWNSGQLIERLHDSIAKFVKDADPAVVERLAGLIKYVTTARSRPSRSCASCWAARSIHCIIWPYRPACFPWWSRNWRPRAVTRVRAW